jgi:2-alkyl-3-oxoalkanoate reductase
MKVAIIGATGCVGTRMIESFQLGDGPTVTAITRHASDVARPARFAIDLRLADFTDADSLARSLSGCSAAVHTMEVETSDLKRSATAFCRAAAQVGLRRVVYLSSADVHGLNPASGTNEKTALHSRHASAHVNALVLAERQFVAEARELGLSAIVLRPGVIYGPRSDIIANVADQLQQGRAWAFHNGEGICNCVYVDNVVSAVRLALKTKIAPASAFLVTDEETITWGEFYQAAAHALNLTTHAIHYLGDSPEDTEDENVRPPFVTASDLLPANGTESAALVSRDMIARQHCTWKFPTARTSKELGLENLVPFAEGMQRSAAWWHFAHGIVMAVA